MSTKEHFIAMSGSYGCIPDNIATFERKADAIYHIICTFDYAEIVRCTCDNVEIHNQD